MKQQQLWQILLVTGSVWLGVSIGATASASSNFEGKSKSVGRLLRDSPSTRNLPRLSEIKRPLTSAQILVQSPAPAIVPKPEMVQVTGVKANPTEKGVEVILQTTLGEQLQIVNRSAGNSYIADIPNTQLRLPSGDAFVFRSQKPITGITEITVTNADANTIRVTVTGEAGVPVVNLLQPPQTQPPPPEQPGSETEPSDRSAEDDESIEIVVTGEQETGYRVPDASTATRTDSPIRDIPQSIQVVPRQVIEEQQVIQLDEALRNVSGVTSAGTTGGTESNFVIRGFSEAPILRDGFREFSSFNGFSETANLERIEVLKGPASILFGEIQPGGAINLVTKKPLTEPFYEAELQIGSRNLFRPRIDFSVPLTSDGELLYRLNAVALNDSGFRDFDQNTQHAFIALDESNGILTNYFGLQDIDDENYSLQNNLVGEFATGSIKHTVLLGVDLNRSENKEFTGLDFSSPISLNIFDPVYGSVRRPSSDELPLARNNKVQTDRLGVYAQDQISLADNLKLLAGLRYDTVEQTTTNKPTEFEPTSSETTQNDDAFTPRVGIVYQPIEELSLYASYSRSFTPTTSTTFEGDPLEPERGEGWEVGVKTELLSDQLFATLAYFDITKQNVATAEPNNPLASVATGER